MIGVIVSFTWLYSVLIALPVIVAACLVFNAVNRQRVKHGKDELPRWLESATIVAIVIVANIIERKWLT